jgi:glucosamine-6-phosphate deaminase
VTVVVRADRDVVARDVATIVRDTVSRQPRAVLGLPTGRTPIPIYAELRAAAAAGAVDFAGVATFNLDEFVGLAPDDPRSYRAFMERELFAHVPIAPARVGFLSGTATDLDAECARYERAIAEAGGIDLLLLGLGANGHVGFNEPAADLIARTHVATLLPATRATNAEPFGGDVAAVPRLALSMGMATILQARRIVLVATGASKAAAAQAMVEGPLTTQLPASFLQLHPDVSVVLDEAAASRLAPASRLVPAR